MIKVKLVSLKNQKAFELKSRACLKYSCRFFTIISSICTEDDYQLTSKSLSKNDSPIFYGFKISKKIGISVARNKLRRRLKNIFSKYFQLNYKFLSIIFIPKILIKTIHFSELETEMVRALNWSIGRLK